MDHIFSENYLTLERLDWLLSVFHPRFGNLLGNGRMDFRQSVHIRLHLPCPRATEVIKNINNLRTSDFVWRLSVVPNTWMKNRLLETPTNSDSESPVTSRFVSLRILSANTDYSGREAPRAFTTAQSLTDIFLALLRVILAWHLITAANCDLMFSTSLIQPGVKIQKPTSPLKLLSHGSNLIIVTNERYYQWYGWKESKKLLNMLMIESIYNLWRQL